MIMVTANLARMEKLMDALQLVSELKGEAIDAVVAREAGHLSGYLYKGFAAHQWGGKPRQKNIAERELKARTAGHLGTFVRPSILSKFGYAGKIAGIRAQRVRMSAKGKDVDKNRQRAVSLWQKMVGKEIATRQAGIGVLAAGFLWKRGLLNKAGDTVYISNRTGRAGKLEMGPGFARISNLLAGAVEQDAAHQIVSEAIDQLTNSERSLSAKRIRETFEAAFSSMLQGA